MTYALREYAPEDVEAVIALWQEVGLTRPWNDPHDDIAQAHKNWPRHFIVAVDDQDTVIGTVMSGYDGHRGWLYYVAVSASWQSKGIGKALVSEAEASLKALGCVKTQLMVRGDNTAVLRFYDSLGYSVADVVVSGKRLDA